MSGACSKLEGKFDNFCLEVLRNHMYVQIIIIRYIDHNTYKIMLTPVNIVPSIVQPAQHKAASAGVIVHL